MDKLSHKNANRSKRANRVRASLHSNSDRPRLSIYVSLKHISAQIVDDSSHKTLAYSTTVGHKDVTGTMTERAKWVGTDIAKKAKAKKLTKVVFDRGPKLYHGRVAALADAARAAGLEI